MYLNVLRVHLSLISKLNIKNQGEGKQKEILFRRRIMTRSFGMTFSSTHRGDVILLHGKVRINICTFFEKKLD
jgi:hypothetical protein